jgi:ABC-type phosphate/phosphonate transport system substrate-binding protein
MYSTKKTLQRIAALTAALTAVVAISSGSGVQAKIEAKVGDKCTKAQYGKTKKIGAVGVRCTFKNKKYSWTKVATTTATTIPVKVDKSKWPKKFVIGAVPSENASAMTLKYKNLVQLFQDELGIPVEFYSATDYAGIIEAQIANKVDLAFYGPFSYVIAKLNGAKIEPAGVAVSSATGVPGYRAYGVAKANNAAVNTIADFKGKRICFVQQQDFLQLVSTQQRNQHSTPVVTHSQCKQSIKVHVTLALLTMTFLIRMFQLEKFPVLLQVTSKLFGSLA